MERAAFLSSLSFLLPLTSSKDGNDVPAILSELQDCGQCEEMQLINNQHACFVSIEPVVKHTGAVNEKGNDTLNKPAGNDNADGDDDDDDVTVDPAEADVGGEKITGSGMGPAYFKAAKPAEEDTQKFGDKVVADPAMCPFQMNVYKADLPIDPHLNTPTRDQHGNTVTLFGGIIKGGDDNSDSISAQNFVTEAVVVVCVDGCPYQLDLNAVCDIKLEAQEHLPQSLVLEFAVLRMRIFDPDSEAKPFSSVELKKVHKTLQTLHKNEASLCPFPLAGSSWTLPGNEQTTSEGAIKQIKQCLESHQGAWDNVESLEHLLSSPLSTGNASTGNASTTNKALQEFVVTALKNIPQKSSASFVSDSVLVAAMDHCNQSLSQQHDGLNESLDAFWKSSTSKNPKKRARKQSPGKVDAQVDHKVKQECIQGTEAFFQSHKKALTTKYGFSVLPTHG